MMLNKIYELFEICYELCKTLKLINKFEVDYMRILCTLFIHNAN